MARVRNLIASPSPKNGTRGSTQYFQGLFSGTSTPRRETASQLWYTPACPPDAAGLFQSFYALGELFDPAACPGSTRSQRTEATPDDEEHVGPAQQ